LELKALLQDLDPNATVFGSRITSGSGIRGMYGEVTDLSARDHFLTAVDGYVYARDQLAAVCAAFPEQKDLSFVVVRDPRPTGRAIRRALLTGFQVALDDLNASRPAAEQIAFTVYDVGISTTPVSQNSVRHFDASGGVMITASHNPLNWNGYKFLTANREPGNPFSQRGSVLSFPRMAVFQEHRERFLERLASNDEAALGIAARLVSPAERYSFAHRTEGMLEEALESYFLYLRTMAGLDDDAAFDEFAAHARAAKILVLLDHNGGGARTDMAVLLRRFGFDVREMGGASGCPSHDIEPMDNALDDAVKELESMGRGFGVVYDFDADRGTMVFTENGVATALGPQYTCALNEYAMLGLYASNTAYQGRPLVVVINDNTSGSTKIIAQRFASELGIEVRIAEVETGEVNVVEKMEMIRREKSGIPVIGIEGSCGGVIFGGEKDAATSRDGTLTALMAASLILRTGQHLDAIVATLPRFYTTFESIRGITAGDVAVKSGLEREFKSRLRMRPDGTFTVDGIDGCEYRRYDIIHYIGTEVHRTMEKDTSGGYKIRLIDTEGNESFVWYRDSKTELRVYAETDATRELEDAQLFQMLRGAVFAANEAAELAAGKA
jgi:phosphomannomutase